VESTKDRVRRIVEVLSERVEIPTPVLVFTKSRSPVAVRATDLWGRGKIRVSAGFLELAPPDEEKEGIMAHELIHIQRHHTLRGLVAYCLVVILGFSIIVGFVLTSNDLTGTLTFGLYVGLAFTSLVLLSRRYEYEADAGAREATTPMSLIRGLELLEPYQTWWGRITHPSVERRIWRLGRPYRDLPVEGPGVLEWALTAPSEADREREARDEEEGP
jgi:Zn-dependent protease with chaperone function